MSGEKEIVTQAGDNVSVAAQTAEMEKAFAAFMRDVVEVMDSQEIGQWNNPPGYEDKIFIRCGRRDNSGGMPPACARLFHQHRAMGAQIAPKGMRPPVGFESDADRGVYVWYTKEIWYNIQVFKAKRARAQTGADRVLEDQLGQFGGVEIKKPTVGYDTIRKSKR